MKFATQDYSKRKIRLIEKSPYPRVLLNVCTHGNEFVGLKVASYFKKSRVQKGLLEINVANPRAVVKKKRFIDHDLNRVFPGKKNGSYEEKLAYKMATYIKVFDLVIDIHSTESGIKSAVIITKYSSTIKSVIKSASPKYAIFMKATKSNALISGAKNGIAFEYGKDKDKKACQETISAIERILQHLKMTSSSKAPNNKSIEMYEAFGTVEKPKGFLVDRNIKNFKLVRKGTVIGRNKKTKQNIISKRAFYPILFGKNTYKTIFGFMGKKFRSIK